MRRALVVTVALIGGLLVPVIPVHAEIGPPTLTIAPAEQTVAVGQSYFFSVYYDADSPGGPEPPVNVSSEAFWQTLTPEVASSQGFGQFTGEAVGTATIRADYGSFFTTAPLTVVEVLPPPPPPPYETPYSTPYGTPYATPYGTPYSTPYETPYGTPYGQGTYAPPPPAQGTLIVVKQVVNDNGGSASPENFLMHVSGNQPNPANFSGSAAGIPVTMNPGGYSVFEEGPGGYAANFSSGCNGSLAAGEVKTCQLTNDDLPASLTLIVTVVNDNGGVRQPSDFPLFIGYTTTTSGVTVGPGSGVRYVGEALLPGYRAGSWGGDCTPALAPPPAMDPGATGPFGVVALSPGESKVCTIINDDVRPRLTLEKVVVNDHGGMLTAGDFPLFVSGAAISSGETRELDAGYHEVTETGRVDYGATMSGDCDVNGRIVLAVGDPPRRCTIENNDIPGTISGAVFEDVNGNGVREAGEPGLANAVLELSGDTAATVLTDQNGSYAFSGLRVGTYTVRNAPVLGWLQTSADPAPMTIALAQNIGGVNFGRFRLGTVSGTVWDDANRNGVQDAADRSLPDWTVYVDANNNGVAEQSESSAISENDGYFVLTIPGPGAFSICEVVQNTWEQVYPAGGSCHRVNAAVSGALFSGLDFVNAQVRTQDPPIELWRKWPKRLKFVRKHADRWLAEIDASSRWLMREAGYAPDVLGMFALFEDARERCDTFDRIDCERKRFLLAYLETHLRVRAHRTALRHRYRVPKEVRAIIGGDKKQPLAQIFVRTEAKAPPPALSLRELRILTDFYKRLNRIDWDDEDDDD